MQASQEMANFNGEGPDHTACDKECGWEVPILVLRQWIDLIDVMNTN